MEMVLRTSSYDGGENYCRRGARLWCEANGASFEELRNTGLPVSLLEAVGDPMCVRLVAIARREHERRKV